MYQHYICEVPDLGDVLDELNENNERIIGSMYLSDSQQVCLLGESNVVDVDRAVKMLLTKRER